MQSNLPILLSQLFSLSPLLLVYLGGMVLAAVWWRRAPGAAMFAIAGLGLMLLSSVAGSGMTIYVMNNRGSGTMTSFAQTMGVLSFAFSILRAVGLALVVAGVFAGRPRGDEGRAFEVQRVGGSAEF